MKADWKHSRPLTYRRHPHYQDLTEYLMIAAGVALTSAVLFAAWVFGPDIYPWLQSIGVGA